jgi:hypothetical protein
MKRKRKPLEKSSFNLRPPQSYHHPSTIVYVLAKQGILPGFAVHLEEVVCR